MKKKITGIILAMVMALTMLAACGGDDANKAFTEWADQNGSSIAQAANDNAAAMAAAGNDLEAAIAAQNAYLSVLNSAKSSFDRLESNGLNTENKSVYDQQKQSLEAGIAQLTADINRMQELLNNQQQDDGGEEDYYDEDEYYDEDDDDY